MADMVRVKVNGEWDIVLPQHRADRKEWYTKEGWEKKRLDSLYAHISTEGFGKDETVFYVGAEEGEMPALCQMWGARVVMFEPNPKAWSHIRQIWEANKLSFPAGIFTGFASDITEKASPNSEFNGLLAKSEDGWPSCSTWELDAAHGFKELDKEAASFDQVRIDDYAESHQIFPTIISLDVEGAEGMVLRGAEETLRKYHPKIFLSGHPEFLHDNFAGRGGFEYLRNLRTWLIEEFGYREKFLDYQHEVHLLYV